MTRCERRDAGKIKNGDGARRHTGEDAASSPVCMSLIVPGDYTTGKKRKLMINPDYNR